MTVPERPLIDITGLEKRFGGQHALAGVDFRLNPGEIHALLGENGAGKSTLIKILAGVVTRDAGEIRVNGVALPRHHDQADSRAAGLAFVHQDLGLIGSLSVAENLALANGYARRGGLISHRRTERAAREVLERLQIELSPSATVASLPQDGKVMVAVGRAFSANASALVLDEVSSRLPGPETARLVESLRRSRREGIGYIYVTHRLDEVFEVADRVTVLRDGRRIMTADVSEVSIGDLIDAIAGSRHVDPVRRERSVAPPVSKGLALEVKELSGPGLEAPVSLTAASGDVVAFCGLVGSGAQEVAALLGGAARPRAGRAILHGTPLRLGSPVALRKAGCEYVPGDRQAEGGMPSLTARENIFPGRRTASAAPDGIVVRPRRERKAATALLQRFEVRPAHSELPLDAFSGGNQQKVIVARAPPTTDPARARRSDFRRGRRGARRTARAGAGSRGNGSRRAVGLQRLPGGGRDRPSGIRDEARSRLRGARRTRPHREAAGRGEPWCIPRRRRPRMSTAKVAASRGPAALRAVVQARTRDVTHRYGLVLVFAGIVILFTVLRPEIYPTWQNARTIGSTQAVIALLALAAMLPLVVGQFDVSVGYQLGLSQSLCAGLQIKGGASAGVAAAVAIAACLVVGSVNGLLVARFRLPSFIATLAVGTVVLGLTELYSNDETISGPLPDAFTNLGRNSLAGVPLPFIYVLVATAALWLTLEYTAWGRACYATGGGERAAELAGVRTTRAIVSSFLGASLLSGLAGVLSVMILGASSPTVGLGLLLPAFAAAFLGATAIRPGRFNPAGTLIAVYMLAAGITGLQMLGAASYVEQLFNGGALIVALSLSAFVSHRAGRTAGRT